MNIFFKSNLFVSLCTASLTWLTYILSGLSPVFDVIYIVFFSTLFVYSFHRLVKFYGIKPSLSSDVNPGIKNLLLIISALSIAFLIPLIYNKSFSFITFFLISGLLTLWYTMSFIKTRKGHLTLRRIPFLKLILISSIWTLMTVSFPLLDNNFSGNYWILFAERFFFIMSITIPFDIRDIRADKEEGLKTFPTYYGIPFMKKISIYLSILFMGLVMYGYFLGMHNLMFSIALLISTISTIIMLSSVKEKNKTLFYDFGMEGMSILQFLLVMSASYFL